MFYKKEYAALIFGAIISPIIYFIDAYIWWTNKIGNIFIREYFINGIQIVNHGYNYSLVKFGADFMMTISYSLFNFIWIWLVFKYFKKYKKLINKETIMYTSLWFTFWIMIPALSILFNIDNQIVHSVRHMESQNVAWICITIFSYVALLIYKKFDYRFMCKLFLIGMVAAFIMEFPLFVYDIRPNITLNVFIFDILFMINQAIPLLYLIFSFINNKMLK
ncbi:MAG: hypothetical protein QG614_309 [Patescibacteria group bacterium]|nr:hypothetical protein [Patescibacteria group bacterium]